MNRIVFRMFLIGLPLFSLAIGVGYAEDQPQDKYTQISISPMGQYITVEGDKQKFREDQWTRDGLAGGVDEITVHQDYGKDTVLDLAGRAIAGQQDYKFQLELTKKDIGYIRGGFTQYRQYFDNTGGFFKPFTPPAFSLKNDLALDLRDVYVELGLTLPKLPKLVLGYERQMKDGDKSLLEWGSVTQAGNTRKIYPSSKAIEEHTDIFKVSLDHDIKNIHFGDDFRFEHFSDRTDRADTSVNLDTSTSKTVTVHEDYRHDLFFNTFHMDSHLNEKVYWSLGYLYSTLDGSAGLQVTTPPPLGPGDKNWLANAINLDQSSHVLNLNAMFGPFAGLSLYAGAQGERTETTGFTDALLASSVLPATTNLIHSSNDKDSIAGTLGLRYTKIPYTTLYAEGKYTQEQIDLKENESGDIANSFLRTTDTTIFRQDYRAGFNTAPISRVTLAGRYRRYMARNDYDHSDDTAPGYPAFITLQNFTTDEAMGKLSLRPCSRFSVAFTYQLVATDIRTGEAGVGVLVPKGTRKTGNYDANIYSVSATLTPLSRLYLTGLFSLQDTRTTAFDNGSPAVITYKGNVYTAIGTAGFALDNKTDLTAEYSYSRSDNFTDNSSAGLPLGVDYYRHGVIAGLSRKLRENIIARFRYGFYEYGEGNTGGLNNYRAHLFSANCTLRF